MKSESQSSAMTPPFPELPAFRTVVNTKSRQWRWDLALESNRKTWRYPVPTLMRVPMTGRQISNLRKQYLWHPTWRDPVLRRYVLPQILAGYQLSGIFCGVTTIMNANHLNNYKCEDYYEYDYDYADFHKACRLWEDRTSDEWHTAHRLEAAILAGRPTKGIVPDPGRKNRNVEQVYEALYFDVRNFLADRRWIGTRVFADLLTAISFDLWGLQSKLIAYSIGYDEFLSWADGKSSEGVCRLLGLLEWVREREKGLKGFDKPFREGAESALVGWLLRQGDRLRDSLALAPFPDDVLAASPYWTAHRANWEISIPELKTGAVDVSGVRLDPPVPLEPPPPPFPVLPADCNTEAVTGAKWRWELAIAGSPGNNGEAAVTPVRYEDHPAWKDPVLRRYVLPAVGLGFVPSHQAARFRSDSTNVADHHKNILDFYGCLEDYNVFDAVTVLWRERCQKLDARAVIIECYILADLPLGECSPYIIRDEPDVKRLYEALFFDVRPRLGDREWILAHAFNNHEKDLHYKLYEITSKMIAYVFGFEEYQAWSFGTPDEGVTRFERLMCWLRNRMMKHPKEIIWALLPWLMRQADRLKIGEKLAPFPDKELAASAMWKANRKLLLAAFPELQKGPMNVSKV